jgi:RNA-directed DNA polymerase
MMHGPEKSDPAIVAMKPTNNAEQSAEEPVERRAGTKGNADARNTRRTQSRERVSQVLARVRQAANVSLWRPLRQMPVSGRNGVQFSCRYPS